MTDQKNIFLVADVKGWAFDNIAQYLCKILDDQYNVTVLYTSDYKNYDHLLKVLQQYPQIDFIHFFYRGYLSELLVHIINNTSIDSEYIQHFIQIPITTSIPDHLFIDHASREYYKMILSFVDNYYTSSQKLYKIYSEIQSYPKPWKEIIYDNVIINNHKVDCLKNTDALNITWIGNSLWGEWIFGIGNDFKGVERIIKPALQAVQNKIKIHTNIVDSSKQKYPKNEVFDMLNNTDILLISSKNEGTPLPLIEGMATGCAIISTAVGIVPEVLPEIQKPFIVDHNPEDFVNAIMKLHNDRDLLYQLKQENYKAYKKIFCNDDMFRTKWSNLIEDTISRCKNRVQAKKQILRNKVSSRDKGFIGKIIMNTYIRKTIFWLLRFHFIRKIIQFLNIR